jgi:hypothetical protein
VKIGFALFGGGSSVSQTIILKNKHASMYGAGNLTGKKQATSPARRCLGFVTGLGAVMPKLRPLDAANGAAPDFGPPNYIENSAITNPRSACNTQRTRQLCR